MTTSNQFTKDPVGVLDYGWNWSDWLKPGETVAAHTITVETGLTLDSSASDGVIVAAWVSGGTVGKNYAVSCTVTTTQGRTDKRTVWLAMKPR